MTTSMDALFSRRVHFVVGKGGVGKSTVSVALALMAVRRGRRTLLIELEPGGRAGRLLDLDQPADYSARRSPAGVWSIAVDGRSSLEEYLGLIIPARRVLKAVLNSKVYQYFVAAAPGLKELMAVGKVWYEAERRSDGGQRQWDVVIVLESPTETAVHLVATAEEMPVTETIEAYTVLAGDLRLPLGLLVVNRMHHGAAPDRLVERLKEGARTLVPTDARVATEVARCAAEENAWAAINRAQLERLRVAVPLPAVVLPMVFAPEFGPDDVAALSRLLEGQCVDRADATRPPLGERG
jgi:anion-transporting  ArsA/GET3 family ATPase